jgi:hypothetical protein
VSDPVTTARAARESLSRGLNALQSDPNIPPQLLDLAAPIAQAMGALHAIERSNGTQLVPHAEVALTHTRAALGQLQAQPPNYAAVTQAMEAVASSLAAVHALTKMVGAPAPGGPAFAPTAPQPAQAFPPQAQAFPPPPQAFPPQAQAAPQQFQPAPPQAQAARDPFAAQRPAGAPGAAPDPSSLRPPSPPAPGDLQIISADLGTQSPTNFYKGLSGNDIIEHGGLFVSTYMIPKIGSSVRLKISLPGGYEFEANAVVKWSREQGGDDGAAPPGFGAQFTQITPEARQLVYRYTRNREPLFHDDL